MDLTGRTLLGKYEIEGLLGQGGMGAVWRARHVLTGRKLAIKTLDARHLENEGVVQRFGREARAASACRHPGIVEVLDLDRTEEGIPFLVMELLEGETLARRIERRGRLTQHEVVDLGTKLLEALEAAHDHGIIHRDLKPENIFVVPAGRRGEMVKILDFGISHKSDEAAAKLTMTGSVLGTPHYMSPEQARGEAELDHRVDLYAAGVVLYECAVGDVPFDAGNYNKLLRTILDEEPVPPRRRGAQITPELERFILWAMEKDRDRRIGSAREMIVWLGRAAAGEMPPYVAPSGAEPGRVSSPGVFGPAATYTPAGALPPPPGGLGAALGTTELAAPSRWSTPGGRAVRDEPTSDELELALPSVPPPSWPAPAPGSRSSEGRAPVERGRGPIESAAALELDESALRSSLPPAVAPPPASAAPAAGAPGAVAIAGARATPPPAADVAGRRGLAASKPSASAPFWLRYALWGTGIAAAFVGLVFLVRWVVQPGIDDAELEAAAPAPDPAPVAPPPDEPRAVNWVRVAIEGLPPGASVRLDGIPASTPMRVPRGGSHVIEISAPGYEDRRIELVADRNQLLHAGMRPAVDELDP